MKKNNFISNSMSLRRFEELFPKLHFAEDRQSNQVDDKYLNVRQLLNLINNFFCTFAPANRSFSVNDSMIEYYSRQFLRGKPIRFCFKACVLASLSGYCMHLQMYPGPAEKKTDEYDFGSSGNVVYYVAKKLRILSLNCH